MAHCVCHLSGGRLSFRVLAVFAADCNCFFTSETREASPHICLTLSSRLYFIPSILSPLSAYLCSSSGIKQHFSSHSLHHLVASSSLTALLLCLPVCHLPHSRILSSQISVYSHTVTSPRPAVLFFARLPLRTHFRLPFAFYFPRSFSLFSLIPLFCNASARTFSFDPPSCLWQLKPSYPVSYLFRLHFLHIFSTSTHFGIFNTSRDFTMLRCVRICPLFAC